CLYDAIGRLEKEQRKQEAANPSANLTETLAHTNKHGGNKQQAALMQAMTLLQGMFGSQSMPTLRDIIATQRPFVQLTKRMSVRHASALMAEARSAGL